MNAAQRAQRLNRLEVRRQSLQRRLAGVEEQIVTIEQQVKETQKRIEILTATRRKAA